MKRIDVAPGSDEWRQARIGIPTASCAHKIVTPAGKPSSQRDGYMHELIAERLLGTWLDSDAGAFAERGTILEPSAIAYYELIMNADTIAGGFCTTDDGRVGCSPDKLVVGAGRPARGLEVKCPKPATHVGYMLSKNTDERYRCQLQTSLYVTGLESWDICSFHPDMPPAIIRVQRDEPLIKLLGDRLREFCDELDEKTEILRARQPTGD